MAECSLAAEMKCAALTEAQRRVAELETLLAGDRQVLKSTRAEWTEREHKLQDQLRAASQTIATLEAKACADRNKIDNLEVKNADEFYDRNKIGHLVTRLTCDLSAATAAVDALRKTNIGLIAERDNAESLRYAAQKYSKEAFERGKELGRERDDALGKNKELAEVALKLIDKSRAEMAVELAEAQERIKSDHQLIRDIHNTLTGGTDVRRTTLEVAISVCIELAEAKAQIKALERQRAESRERDEALKAVDRLTRPGEHTAVIDDLRKVNAKLSAELQNAENSRAAAWEAAKEAFAKGQKSIADRIASIRRWLTTDEEGVSTEDIARRVGDELRTAKKKLAKLQALRPDLVMTDITAMSCRKLAAYDAIKELVSRVETAEEGKNVDGTV